MVSCSGIVIHEPPAPVPVIIFGGFCNRLVSCAVLTAGNLGTYPRCCAPNSLLARFSYLDVWRGAGSGGEAAGGFTGFGIPDSDFSIERSGGYSL